MLDRRIHGDEVLLAIADPAGVFAPIHLSGISLQIRATDMMMSADLSPAQPREETLRLVRAGVGAAIRLGMVDPAGVELGVKLVPMRGLVRMNDAAVFDTSADHRKGRIFGTGDERNGLALPLAHDDDDPTLAVLVLRKAPIAPIILVVCRLHITADVAAIDFHFTRYGIVLLRRQRLADLMGEDECGLVLDIQVAAQLEGAMPLGAVHEDCDGE